MKNGVSGNGIAYAVKGSGQPVIFIHGWAMAGSVWCRQIEYFSRAGFEAIAVDLRGHGDSSKEGPFTISQMAFDLKGFIHEMGYECPVLAGWSMGAMVALEYAVKHPHAASRICLTGGTPRFTASEGYPHGLPTKDVKGMKTKLKKDFARAISEFRETIIKDMPFAQRDIIMEARLPSFEAAKAGLGELMSVDLREKLGNVRTSVLLVHGERDSICLAGASNYMAERIPSAELFIIREAGHVPFLSNTELFNGKLEEFVRGKSLKTSVRHR